MAVSKIDDWGNEKQHGGPERKDACHEFAESHKAFNYCMNGFQQGYNENKNGHIINSGSSKDSHEGNNEGKVGHHGFKNACPECKDACSENHDGYNGFQDPK
jgi:hypothetical protein